MKNIKDILDTIRKLQGDTEKSVQAIKELSVNPDSTIRSPIFEK
jgi:hypothetical protein